MLKTEIGRLLDLVIATGHGSRVVQRDQASGRVDDSLTIFERIGESCRTL